MRLDRDHVRKIERAVKRSPPPEVKLDVGFMSEVLKRLSLWERGLLMQAIDRATTARRRTIEQRVLLAMLVHDDEERAS
jgi:hypothetical protein